MSARNYDLNVSKKQGVILVVDNEHGLKSVDYRGTQVVIEESYNSVRLNTNGWKTATSKTAINRYFQQRNLDCRVFQEKGYWYVEQKGEIFDYVDNKVLTF